MTYCYILDENGDVLSWDGKKRYKCYKGKDAYAYLSSAEGSKKHFIKSFTKEIGGDECLTEVEAENWADIEKEQNRTKYVENCRTKSGYKMISLSSFNDDDANDDCEKSSGEEFAKDENVNVEISVEKKILQERIRKEVMKLSEEDSWLINSLFFDEEVKSILHLAAERNVPRTTISSQKSRIFSELKESI